MENYTEFKEILRQTQEQLANDRKLSYQTDLVKRIDAMNKGVSYAKL